MTEKETEIIVGERIKKLEETVGELKKLGQISKEEFLRILILGECEVIPKNFAQRSSKMTDFRNILIHLYLKVDPEEVYKNFKKAPEEFTKFAKYFLKFLE